MNENCPDPGVLVSPEWLQAQLGNPGVRIYECTTALAYLPPGAEAPYRVVSGADAYRESHVEGAAFLDIDGELSAPDSPPHLRFTLPDAGRLAAALGARGIGGEHRVVLYTRGKMQWATRVWWMLRWLGFDRAGVLDGGFERWSREGRPVAAGDGNYPGIRFERHSPRPGLFVGKDRVRRALTDPRDVLVNALDPDLHRGENARYGRPGRISGSVNVPATDLVDPVSNRQVDLSRAARRFAEAGVDPESRVVLYCGGGIAATLDAFVLHQLGYADVSVYDASLSEWARDATLPMESDLTGGATNE